MRALVVASGKFESWRFPGFWEVEFGVYPLLFFSIQLLCSLIARHENRSSIFRRPGYFGAALLDQRKVRRRDDRLLREHRTGRRTQGVGTESNKDRCVKNLYRRFAGRIRARLYFSADSVPCGV